METKPTKHILIIEDEADVVELLARQLKKTGGFNVISASDGEIGLKLALDRGSDLIVLDLMLPKMSGLEVCRALKSEQATAHTPIMMLTAKAEEVDRIVGLEFGADDYVTKPFSPREVALRIAAILRRAEGRPVEKSLVIGEMAINLDGHELRVAGKPVDLTPIEFKLLATLAQRRGRVQPRDRLLNDVWGYDALIYTRTVDTHIRRLREKLGKHGDHIETLRGIGYRFRQA